MMYKKSFLFILALFALGCISFMSIHNKPAAASSTRKPFVTGIDSTSKTTHSSLYQSLLLDSLGLNNNAFDLAVRGWEKLKTAGKLSKSAIMTIADFSQPSAKKRLYVIDMEAGKLLYNTYVAHGRNSGKDLVNGYSNRPRSNKSSPGFYRTEQTYYGSNGYSLRLEGLEKGINDNADRRAIVMHGADYVNEQFIERQGYIGRSLGCPAIPMALVRPVINTIKDGSCLFIYSPQPTYASRSAFLR